MTNKRVLMTEEQILAIADDREFFVHKYGERHEKLRKLTRRMCKDGKITLVQSNSRGFNYLSPRLAQLSMAIDEFLLTSDPLSPEDF